MSVREQGRKVYLSALPRNKLLFFHLLSNQTPPYHPQKRTTTHRLLYLQHALCPICRLYMRYQTPNIGFT